MKEGGVRLDAAILNAIPSTTRAFVKDAIAAGNVLIADPNRPHATLNDPNLHRAAKGLKLRGGETIHLTITFQQAAETVDETPASQPEATQPTMPYYSPFGGYYPFFAFGW